MVLYLSHDSFSSEYVEGINVDMSAAQEYQKSSIS